MTNERIRKHQFVPIGDNEYAERVFGQNMLEYICKFCGTRSSCGTLVLVSLSLEHAECQMGDAWSTPEEDAAEAYNCLWDYDKNGVLGF